MVFPTTLRDRPFTPWIGAKNLRMSRRLVLAFPRTRSIRPKVRSSKAAPLDLVAPAEG
jgi:hypothetical protein